MISIVVATPGGRRGCQPCFADKEIEVARQVFSDAEFKVHMTFCLLFCINITLFRLRIHFDKQ